MSIGVKGFLGYGVTIPEFECTQRCEDFWDKANHYFGSIINLDYRKGNPDVFFGVELTEEDLNRAMLNSNLVQEWEHKTWVAFHRIFAADVEMPKPRFVFTTLYLGDII